MTIFESIIYGIIQGVTEFIPVSSSGHLELLNELTDFNGSFENDVLINIGTLVALIFFFRKRIWWAIQDIWNGKDEFLWLWIIISTMPAAAVGYFFIDFFRGDSLRNINTVIVMLAVVGAGMVILDKLFKKEGRKVVNVSDATLVGIAQVLSFIPGTSRSGSTILAGRASGLSYTSAVEYSFLVGIPIIGGAIMRILLTDEARFFISDNTDAFIVGNITSFIVGLIAISAMVSLTKKVGLKYFGYYRLILAGVLLLIVN